MSSKVSPFIYYAYYEDYFLSWSTHNFAFLLLLIPKHASRIIYIF